MEVVLRRSVHREVRSPLGVEPLESVFTEKFFVEFTILRSWAVRLMSMCVCVCMCVYVCVCGYGGT